MNKSVYVEIEEILQSLIKILDSTTALSQAKKDLLYPMLDVLSDLGAINGQLIVKDPHTAIASLERDLKQIVAIITQNERAKADNPVEQQITNIVNTITVLIEKIPHETVNETTANKKSF